jgi:hypothetical protein
MTSVAMITAIVTIIGIILTAVIGLLNFYYGTYLPLQENLPSTPPSSDTTEQETTSPSVVCPRDYLFDPSLKKCIPELEPKLGPVCAEGYEWDETKGVCETVTIPPQPLEPLQ